MAGMHATAAAAMGCDFSLKSAALSQMQGVFSFALGAQSHPLIYPLTQVLHVMDMHAWTCVLADAPTLARRAATLIFSYCTVC
jgi:hypothetical protein